MGESRHVTRLVDQLREQRRRADKADAALLSIWRIFGDRAHLTFGDDPKVVVDEVIQFVSGQLNPVKSTSRPGCATQMYANEQGKSNL